MSSYQWGSYNESDESFGVHRVHMVVYPPSTTRGERAWLRVWRAWPILGLICGVAAYGIAAGQVGSAMAIVVAVAIPGAIAIGLAIRVRGIRSQVAEVLTLSPPHASHFSRGTAALLVAQRLIDSSDLHRHGKLDDVAYRRDWQRAYDYLRGAVV